MSTPPSFVTRHRAATLDLLVAAPLVLATAVLLRAALDLGVVYPVAVTGVYALVALGILRGLPDTLPGRGLGPANRVTLGRILVALPIVGFLAIPDPSTAPIRWTIVGAGAAALALDGLDGWVARRTGSSTAFGARFDMETDAALLLVLSVLVWRTGQTGPWVMGIGMMRYLFVAAARIRPELAGELFPSFRRKFVCVVQGIVLLVALGPIVPPAMASAICAAALLALAGSFAADTAWLLRRGRNSHDGLPSRPRGEESARA